MKKPRRSGALDGYGVWWLITSTPPTHNGFSDVADSLDGMGGAWPQPWGHFYAVAAAASTPGQSAANSASDTTALTSNSMPKPLIQGPR